MDNTTWEVQCEIESSCLLNCVHCSSWDMRQESVRGYSDIDLVNLTNVLNKNAHIYFTGGEPLNFSQLPPLCAKLHGISTEVKIGLYSSGVMPGLLAINDRMAVDLKNAGVVDCFFSIYSDLAKEHDFWTRTDGSFASTIKSIDTMRTVGIDVKAHIVLTKINLHKIDKILYFCAESGISEARILRLAPIGEAKNNWDEIGVSLNQQNQLIHRLVNDKSQYNIKLSFSGYPLLHPCRSMENSKGCQAGLKLLYIDIHGNIYPCACVKDDDAHKICHITEMDKIIKYLDSIKEDYRLDCLNQSNNIM